jgi:hypothetical protein
VWPRPGTLKSRRPVKGGRPVGQLAPGDSRDRVIYWRLGEELGVPKRAHDRVLPVRREAVILAAQAERRHPLSAAYSQLERLAQVLTDSIGPRLTGSPGAEAAAQWSLRPDRSAPGRHLYRGIERAANARPGLGEVRARGQVEPAG